MQVSHWEVPNTLPCDCGGGARAGRLGLDDLTLREASSLIDVAFDITGRDYVACSAVSTYLVENEAFEALQRALEIEAYRDLQR